MYSQKEDKELERWRNADFRFGKAPYYGANDYENLKKIKLGIKLEDVYGPKISEYEKDTGSKITFEDEEYKEITKKEQKELDKWNRATMMISSNSNYGEGEAYLLDEIREGTTYEQKFGDIFAEMGIPLEKI